MVDLLLELVGFCLKGFFGFATVFLAFLADFVRNGEDEAFVGFDIFIWQRLVRDADDFAL